MRALSIEKQLSVWRPLRVGSRVRVTCRWRKGHVGTIIERFDPDRLDGRVRYAVRLDGEPNLTADVVRCELRPWGPKQELLFERREARKAAKQRGGRA